MVKLYSVEEMLELEKEANRSGLSYDMMMENAGQSLAEEIERAFSQDSNKNILALVGSGNNGGDALVALAVLAIKNWRGTAYIVRSRPDDDPLVSRFENNGGQVVTAEADNDLSKLGQLIEQSDILIDAVFGTGIKLPLRGSVAQVLMFCKKKVAESATTIHVVAVDCPSGVDCENGEVAEETIPAELTVTMAGIKSGCINTPAAGYLGRLRIGNIGQLNNLSTYKQNNKFILDHDIVKSYLPARPVNAHKGTFGTALIVAGSVNYTGAAYLAGMAAYLSGVGLVTLAVPAPLHAALSGEFPEATWVLLPHELGVISQDAARIVKQNLPRATALLIGPGFGLEEATADFMRTFFSGSVVNQKDGIGFIRNSSDKHAVMKLEIPLIIDADGLKLISKNKNWHEMLPPNSILTPHPGEMSVLTGLTIDQIQKNRIETATEYAKKWGHIVVLKSAYTIVASPDGRIGIVPIATPALARAGTGDVLAGLMVGLCAQGVSSFEAACASAWVHANAGVIAADNLGTTSSVIARDVLNAIPKVISSL